jgi:predicted phage tail protein
MIDADASDSDGTISRVDFNANGTLLASDNLAPFEISWENVPAGSYSLTAIATDNFGASSTSAAVNIVVTNSAPLVAITSPASGSSFASPASIAITIAASDTDGTIARVDVYAGTTLLGSDSSAPFAVTWNNAPLGNHSITARAIDNLGATSTSAAITLTLAAPALPIAPSGLIATTISRQQIDLRWTDNSHNELGFKIRRSVNGSAFNEIARVEANVATFSDTEVRAGKKYAYRVRVYNALGNSPSSNTATTRTPRALLRWLTADE